MKDIDDVVLAYEEALRLGKVKVSPKMTIPEQVARYRQSQSVNAAIVAETRLILAGRGVTTIMYPAYLNFALQVRKLVFEGISGEALQLEVQVLIGTWVARGLSLDVLEAIRTDVFDIPDLPGPQSPLPE